MDSKGRKISLGAILGKGGEGTVYEVRHSADTAAKVYHGPLSADRRAKIQAMVNIRTEGLGTVAAWPLDLLALRESRQAIGLLMPKVANKKNIHHVYGPKSRLKDFPKADWRFLIRTAANVARAFVGVHEAKCVIGDVNHGSIMVAEDATVSLIDCDSFQVGTPGRQFLCDVGVETFTPPELQGKPFRGAVRTPNFDNFGLAVMVFHLLFMGRHPFAGRFFGVGEMPIAKAIKECRFPYSAQHLAMQMEQPPGTPPLSFTGNEIAQLFEKAFSRPTIMGGRPLAREWVSALVALEKSTKQCGISRSHWYPSHLAACPWCRMESLGANPLFPFVMPAGVPGGGVDVEGLWRMLQALENPGPAPSIESPIVPPSAEAVKVAGAIRVAQPVAAAVGFCVFVAGVAFKPALFWLFGIGAFLTYIVTLNAFSRDSGIERFRKLQSEAEAAVEGVRPEWERRAGGQLFHEAKARFINLKAEFDDIPKRRFGALEALKAVQRKQQLNNFLAKFEIEDAQIEGIGPARKRLLESYGIEAADDVVASRLQSVPGFGNIMIGRLVGWRLSIERKFVFDSTRTIDPRDIAKVEQKIQALRSELQNSLKTVHEEVMKVHAEISAARRAMRPKLEQLANALGQARADYNWVKAI